MAYTTAYGVRPSRVEIRPPVNGPLARTGTSRATSAHRPTTDPLRKTALVAGILYLLTFAPSIPAVFLMGPALTNPDYILGAGADRQVTLGAFLDIITALGGIGTAVALFMIGPGMAGLDALLLGTLLYRSGLVPRIIPTLGLIGAPLYWSAQIATMFGFNETTTIWSGIGLAPIFIWELSLGLWMTFKGFQRSAPLMVEAAAETARLAGPTATPPSTTGVAPGAGAA